MMNCWSRRTLQILSLILATLVYNEFLVYYLTIYRCNWPELSNPKLSKVMFIADTHLLGPNGHWWDRLRREWQMQRTFQTSLQLLKPEVIFILGDLFDEGKWADDISFNKDVQRFHKMFQHSPDVRLVTVIGNHDVGFHYMINNHKLKRFVRAVNSSDSVSLLHHKDVNFVTVNSMAFEGDDCSMCTKAEQDLRQVSAKLECSRKNWKDNCESYSERFTYSRPILLQHFPMFRVSDSHCTGSDSAPEDEKYERFRPRYDCLSKQASDQLMDAVKPRLIISGHTHHFCHTKHDNGVDEWSVPSFSWRNHKGPSFFLVSLTGQDHAINKCFIPNENTVVMVYGVVIAALLLYIIFSILRCTLSSRRSFNSYKGQQFKQN